MKIGILQPGHAPEEVRATLGDYPDMYERLLAGNGFTFARWYVVDGDFPAGPEDADGWLIGGSRHGVYEDHDWLPPLEELARDIAASGRPLIGVCFGHQLIAQAFGGRVEKYAGGWAVGRTLYDFGDEHLALNAWHQDQVIELPEGAQRIASNDFCTNAAMAIGDNLFSLQPHPEYTAEMLEALFAYRAETAGVPAAIVDSARARIATPVDNEAMADRMAGFYKTGAR